MKEQGAPKLDDRPSTADLEVDGQAQADSMRSGGETPADPALRDRILKGYKAGLYSLEEAKARLMGMPMGADAPTRTATARSSRENGGQMFDWVGLALALGAVAATIASAWIVDGPKRGLGLHSIVKRDESITLFSLARYEDLQFQALALFGFGTLVSSLIVLWVLKPWSARDRRKSHGLSWLPIALAFVFVATSHPLGVAREGVQYGWALYLFFLSWLGIGCLPWLRKNSL